MTHETEPTSQEKITDACKNGLEGKTPNETQSFRETICYVAFAAITEGATVDQALAIASELHVCGEVKNERGGLEGAVVFRARFGRTTWEDY